MSALADGRARGGSRPPSYRLLLVATLAAQIVTALALWVVQLPFALLGIAPSSMVVSLWLPWGVDGPWSLLGAAGYVLIVCVLGGSMISGRVTDRGMPRPAPIWAWLAFGASGYAGMALGETGGARLVLAVVLAPLTLRLFAYRVDGSPRPWPALLSPGRRGLVPVLAAGLVLALSYSATHAFVQNGSGASSSTSVPTGRTAIIAVGLQGIALPSHLTAVALNGRGVAAVAVTRAAVMSESWRAIVIGGPAGVPGAAAHTLPAGLSARADSWLAIRVRLRTCPARSPRIDAITLRYRVLGIDTSERIPLWSVMRLVCRGPGTGGSSLSA